MAIIFYYVEKENIEGILKDGLKITEFSSNELTVNGETKPYITGFLSPKDDILMYESPDHVCLEIDSEIKDLYVFNGDMDVVGKKEYISSAIPLEGYKFGTYRRPEIAITADASEKNVAVSGKIIGTPILFESSDEIYKDSVMHELRLRYKDFDETLLGIFFMMMVSKGRMRLLGQKKDGTKTVYIYKDISTNKIYTLGIHENA